MPICSGRSCSGCNRYLCAVNSVPHPATMVALVDRAQAPLCLHLRKSPEITRSTGHMGTKFSSLRTSPLMPPSDTGDYRDFYTLLGSMTVCTPGKHVYPYLSFRKGLYSGNYPFSISSHSNTDRLAPYSRTIRLSQNTHFNRWLLPTAWIWIQGINFRSTARLARGA